MPKGNATITDLLNEIFKTTVLPWAANTHLYIALHTANPAASGSQTTSECAYGSYARVSVIRSAVGWTVSGQSSANAALIQFPTCTSGSETATYVSIGTATSGAGQLVYVGALNTSLPIATTIQPQFAIGALTATES